MFFCLFFYITIMRMCLKCVMIMTHYQEFVLKYDPNIFSSDFTRRITYEQNKLKMPYFFQYHINALSLISLTAVVNNVSLSEVMHHKISDKTSTTTQ